MAEVQILLEKYICRFGIKKSELKKALELMKLKEEKDFTITTDSESWENIFR